MGGFGVVGSVCREAPALQTQPRHSPGDQFSWPGHWLQPRGLQDAASRLVSLLLLALSWVLMDHGCYTQSLSPFFLPGLPWEPRGQGPPGSSLDGLLSLLPRSVATACVSKLGHRFAVGTHCGLLPPGKWPTLWLVLLRLHT